MQKEADSGRIYIRCAESHVLRSGSTFNLIICMTPVMSFWLIQAVRFSIDTSFKRLHSWQEFEIESWSHQHMRCKY